MAKLTCGVSTTSDLVSTINAVEDGSVIVNSGLIVSVSRLTIDGFTGAAGDITLPPSGTWFVGFDLFTKEIISLPRLGHSGWIPLAKCATDATSVVSVEKTTPLMPECRLPKTLAKIASGEVLSVVIIGSSLAEENGDDSWPGMVFSDTSGAIDYRLGANITRVNAALGGAPSMYGLAQTGFFGSHTATDYTVSGHPSGITTKTQMNGESALWDGVDLVVMTSLANGGERRLDCIEPTIRNLRKMGIEVLLTSDNPGDFPYTIDEGTTSQKHVDGYHLIDLVDRYGLQFADTSSYVIDAALRYPDVDIYTDTVHMQTGLPSGRVGEPSCGHEVWARAIRSTIPVDSILADNYTFDTDSEGWGTYQEINCKTFWHNGVQRAEKTTEDVTLSWGHLVEVPAHKEGDIVTVTLTMSSEGYVGNVVLGLTGGGSGWSSNTVQINAGTHTETLTAIRDNNLAHLVILPSGSQWPIGEVIDVDDVTITVTRNGELVNTRINRGQKSGSQLLPESIITKDYTKPAGAFVSLPRNRRRADGTLVAHPYGSSSFARRADPDTPATEDLLEVTVGEKMAIAANGAVGFSMILCEVTGTPEATVEVYSHNNLIKTITLPAQTATREKWYEIITPNELGVSIPEAKNLTYDLRVTAGTVRVAALISLTSEISYVTPEEINYIGTWGAKVDGGSFTGMLGYATDTLDDYASLIVEKAFNRLGWLVTGQTSSKLVDIWDGGEKLSGVDVSGTGHERVVGNIAGKSSAHYIKCNATLAGGGDSTNGWGLHICGAILVHDR